MPFPTAYWWVSNLLLGSETDRKYILQEIYQDGSISLNGWKTLLNSGTLEADSNLSKKDFIEAISCKGSPSCAEFKMIIESYKLGILIPEDSPENVATIDGYFAGENKVGNTYNKKQIDSKIDLVSTGTKGVLKVADLKPVGVGKYELSEIGTYTNLTPSDKPILAEEGYFNSVYWDGVKFDLLRVKTPSILVDKEINKDSSNAIANSAIYPIYDNMPKASKGASISIDFSKTEIGWIDLNGKLQDAGLGSNKFLNFYKVNKGDVITGDFFIDSASNGISFYTSDSQSTFSQGLKGSAQNKRIESLSFTAPSDGYFRLFTGQNVDFKANKTIQEFTITKAASADVVDFILRNENPNKPISNATKTISDFNKSGYINNNGALVKGDASATDYYTDFIAVKSGHVISINSGGADATNAISFYLDSSESAYYGGVKAKSTTVLNDHTFTAPSDGYVRLYLTDGQVNTIGQVYVSNYPHIGYILQKSGFKKLYAEPGEVTSGGGTTATASNVEDPTNYGLSTSATAETNSSAINRALDMAFVNNKKVVLPAGTFKHVGIRWRYGVEIEGQGREKTILKSVDASPAVLMVKTEWYDLHEGQIKGLTLDGANIGTNGLEVTSSFGVIVSEVNIRNFTNIGLSLRGALFFNVSNCKIELCRQGVWVKPMTTNDGAKTSMSPNLSSFYMTYLVQCRDICAEIDNTANITFDTCNFEDSGVSGDSNTGGVVIKNMSPNGEGVDCNFINCWSEGIRGFAILRIDNGNGGVTSVTNCNFHKIGNGQGSVSYGIVNRSKLLINGGSKVWGFPSDVLTTDSGQTRVRDFGTVISHSEVNGGSYDFK